MLVTFTGGEPTLRRDLEDLVAGVDRAISLKYITLITHGAMLTPERAQSLWDAGINQFNISLDYLDERHDAARGIPGLAANDSSRRSRDARARHRRHPLQHRHQERQPRSDPADRRAAPQRAGRRRELQRLHRREERQYATSSSATASSRELEDVVRQLLAFKRRKRGVITNSDYYLEQIPRYVRGEMTRAVPVRHPHDSHRSRPAT